MIGPFGELRCHMITLTWQWRNRVRMHCSLTWDYQVGGDGLCPLLYVVSHFLTYAELSLSGLIPREVKNPAAGEVGCDCQWSPMIYMMEGHQYFKACNHTRIRQPSRTPSTLQQRRTIGHSSCLFRCRDLCEPFPMLESVKFHLQQCSYRSSAYR